MREHLVRLFRYDAWANSEVLASLGAANPPPARSVRLLAHILSAEKLWLERLSGEKPSLPVWPEFNLSECEQQASELKALWTGYFSSLDGNTLGQPVTYHNSKGEAFSSAKQDILLHVTMHGSYHRGQIATDMRTAGFAPAYTDFIHAVRQGFIE